MNLPSVLLYGFSVSFIMALAATGLLLYLQYAEIRLAKLCIGILAFSVIFGGLGLLLSKLESLISSFVILSLCSFITGTVHVIGGNKLFLWFDKYSFKFGLITTLVWMAWSALGFTLVYSLLSDDAAAFLPYLVAGMIPFLVPFLFRLSYHYWMSIPKLRYRRWHYDPQDALPIIEPINLVRVNIRFTRVPDEPEPAFEGYVVELPGDVSLGSLYQYFIYSHNYQHRDYKKHPITYALNGRALGWVLFKAGAANERIYLDTAKSLRQNNIRENDTILAQSYSD